MPQVPIHPDAERISENLRKTVELTELALILRQAALGPNYSASESIVQVMREIRLAKEQAWQQSRS